MRFRLSAWIYFFSKVDFRRQPLGDIEGKVGYGQSQSVAGTT